MNLENIKKVIYPEVVFNQDYRITENGEVWSPYRGWHKVKLSETKKGYLRAGLMTSEGRKFFMVHRLVLEAYNPTKDSLFLQVNHIDGNKHNNNLSNLEWCTNQENMDHAMANGLAKKAKGEDVGGAKLKESEVIQIAKRLSAHDYNSLSSLGEEYGVSKYCISDIKRRRSWSWLTKDYDF